MENGKIQRIIKSVKSSRNENKTKMRKKYVKVCCVIC